MVKSGQNHAKIDKDLHLLFKHLLRNDWADWSQISYGVSMGWGNKSFSNGPGHMTKMAAMPTYGKNLKKSSSPELKADDLDTWYAASGARVLPNLFKLWPFVDLDLFYGKVIFGPLCFCMGKG